MPNNGEKSIYLTFDDGPIPEVTPWVLDLLKQHDIPATFFCVGENVFKHPEVFSQVVEAGHAVGNHTYNHIQGLKSPNSSYFQNVELANRLINSKLFRPPHGWLKRSQYRFLSRRYKIIMWDVISCDYNRNIPKEEVLANVLNYTRNGSIITFHDSLKAQTHLQWVLPRAIEALKAEGYTFRKIEFPKERRLFTSPYKYAFHRLRQSLREHPKGA